MTKKSLYLGDEAIAQAALDAGISGAYAYPGTPSTEILEHIQQAPEAAERGIHHNWSANEKTSVEEALGMVYAGRRALVSMKHVGMNVAADAFINSAITGVNGGLVVVTADDPSMHSSQNEQDSRFYAKFAGIPFLEPSSQQQAYDMVRAAFDLSEQVKLPVLVRITTRLAHSRAPVQRAAVRAPNPLRPVEDHSQFILLPGNARRNYEALIAKQPALVQAARDSVYNRFDPGDGATGPAILAAGLTGNYLDELFPGGCPHPTLRLGQYPLAPDMVQPLARTGLPLLILEEGMPFIEEALRGFWPGGPEIRGRLDGVLPRTGELSPDAVAVALGISRPSPASDVPDIVRPRPPQLCKGCPHADSFNVLSEILRDRPEARVFADIGCYTLGALPPYQALHTCVDMGASISMAKGASDAGLRPALAVIGDSTFTHSGMTGLLDAVVEGTDMTVLILDNETTGMTGRQTSHATGRLENIVLGLGVDPAHLVVIPPLRKHHEENLAVIRAEIDWPGVSVVIAQRSCIHIKRHV